MSIRSSILSFIFLFGFATLLLAQKNPQQALYGDGTFTSSHTFFSWEIPSPPVSMDQFKYILSAAPFLNRSLSPIDSSNAVPCVSIVKGQSTGFRLIPAPSSPGIAFLLSSGLCPCESCIRPVRCCGDIQNADGTVTRCYTTADCNSPGKCLRNFECSGIANGLPIAAVDDLKDYVDSGVAESLPCVKVSPAASGTFGQSPRLLNSGQGFTPVPCPNGGHCIGLKKCCVTANGPKCYAFVPCCVTGQPSSTCLTMKQCDTPTVTG